VSGNGDEGKTTKGLRENEVGPGDRALPGKTKKNLTQSRLRPVSPFSYVGQGRKGAKKQD